MKENADRVGSILSSSGEAQNMPGPRTNAGKILSFLKSGKCDPAVAEQVTPLLLVHKPIPDDLFNKVRGILVRLRYHCDTTLCAVYEALFYYQAKFDRTLIRKPKDRWARPQFA